MKTRSILADDPGSVGDDDNDLEWAVRESLLNKTKDLANQFLAIGIQCALEEFDLSPRLLNRRGDSPRAGVGESGIRCPDRRWAAAGLMGRGSAANVSQ